MELSEFREDINQDVKAMSSITGDGISCYIRSDCC
jgi:hypothetical protein